MKTKFCSVTMYSKQTREKCHNALSHIHSANWMKALKNGQFAYFFYMQLVITILRISKS